MFLLRIPKVAKNEGLSDDAVNRVVAAAQPAGQQETDQPEGQTESTGAQSSTSSLAAATAPTQPPVAASPVADIVEARRRDMMKEKMEELFQFLVQPSVEAPQEDLDTMLEQAVKKLPEINEDNKLHCFWYDAGADAEPSIAAGGSQWSTFASVDKPALEKFFTAASRVIPSLPAGSQFMTLGAARTEGASAQIAKHARFDSLVADPVHIVYKEPPFSKKGNLKQRRKCHEKIHGWVPSAKDRELPVGPRAFYTQSSRTSDCIVNAHTKSPMRIITVSLKREILGTEGMLPGEADMPPDELTGFFCQEKVSELQEELMEHYDIGSLTTWTVGSGTILRAAAKRATPAIVFAKSASHVSWLRTTMLDC